MEYEQIKKLIDDMGNSKLTSINIDFPDGTKISMTKEESKTVVVKEKETRCMKENSQEENIEQRIEQSTNSKVIKSPMVGTFYSKPSPTADKYVEVRK